MEEQKTRAMELTSYLIEDGSIPLNKKLMHSLGTETAIFYGELIRKFDYFDERDQLTEDGYFYNTIHHMRADTGLTKHKQSNIIEKLVSLGLIKKENRVNSNWGPQKVRHFKIIFDYDKIDELLNEGKEERKSLVETLAARNEKDKQRLLNYVNATNEVDKIHPAETRKDKHPKTGRVNGRNSAVNKNITNKNKTNKINKDSSFNLENPQNPADKVMKYYLDRVKQYFEPPKVNDKWKKLINSRLEDYGVDEIKSAIDAVASNDFYNGKEDQDFKATPKYIFSDDNLAKWISNSKKFNSSIGDDIIPDYYADLD